MPQPFDATLKHLLEKYPHDWLRLIGVDTQAGIKSVDADLATVSAAADKVFQILDPIRWLLHLEMQSSYKSDIPDRLHLGNTVLYRRHKQPVRSVAVLLRPEADGRAMSGILTRRFPPGQQYLEFRYEVLRVWRIPVESILSAGLGTLPLAPLADEPKSKLPAIIKKMASRTESETSRGEEASIWTAAYVLMGLSSSFALLAIDIGQKWAARDN